MYPVLFSLGAVKLYSYGLLMALGVLAALKVFDYECERYGWNKDRLSRMVVGVFLLGLVGARGVYVLTRLSDPAANIWDLIFNFRAGFVYYGGYAAAWLALIGYLKWWGRDLNFWAVLDTSVLGICIGLALGRIGCLLGGCCYGSATTLPWGVIMVAEPHLGHLHPVQFYEFLFLVIFFVYLWRLRLHKAYEGQILVQYTFVYSIGRYLLEFLRGDLIRGFVIEPWLSTSQFIGLLFIPVAIWLHFKLRPKKSQK